MKPYQYDVFLSFTGADRELKNQIGQYLKSLGLTYYDSDLYCKGQFRPDFCRALDESRVYLLILSDHLRRIPTEGSAETLTEVRRECSLAAKYESHNELNMVILCLSEYFRFDRPFHDHDDQLGEFFHSLTVGFSQIRGEVDENGMLAERTLGSIGAQCRSFIESRNAGKPIISQAPRFDVATEALVDRGVFVGRESLIKDACKAFREGQRAVLLTGIGGVGKTTLAVEIARRCEEEEGMRCLQVVYVNEVVKDDGDSHMVGVEKKPQRRDTLRTVVSSVTYTREVYDTLPSLTERDRFERKLDALRALPEHVLLVIDNLNDLTENDLRELLSKLKCRLLITTRASIDRSIEWGRVLPVDSLDTDDALEMFDRISGMKNDRDTFIGLYRAVGGHTITLCIMAKLMARHRMSLDELISQMGELETFDARVDFRHNEYGDSDTVMGHLEKLFDIGGCGESGRRILRSMSLLANGTIALRDLMEMLSLRNRNEILELTHSGWLELQTREEGGEMREYLYLHPILSRLMAKQLAPTEENTGEMVAYLARKCDEARSNMTYADATVLENGLYYACFALASSSKRLSSELWTRFVEVNHLLGYVEETAKKTELLAARVTEGDGRAVITSYIDMITLEKYPTRVEILNKYLSTLKHNARDYKWVMRSLSVTLPHVQGVEKFRPFLLQALECAIDAAIDREDDFAVLDLFVYYMVVTKNMSALFRRIRGYVRMRKRKGKESGALIYLDLLLSGSTMTAAKNAADYISKMLAVLNELMDDNLLSTLKMMILHPATAVHMAGWDKRVERLDSSDPMFLPLSVVSGEVGRFANDGQVDATALIEATVHMYQMRLERQVTLTSASNAVSGIIGMLHMFPEAIVRRGTGELVDRVDMNNISVQSLSNLQVAMLINREFNNREAVAQAKQVIEVLEHLYPVGHSSILAATFSYGEICEAFGDNESAMRSYAEVYRQIKTNNPDSAELVKLADKMIRLPVAAQFSLDALGALYQTAQTDADLLTSGAIYRTQNYLYRLFDKVKCREIDYSDARFETVWEHFRRVCEAKNRLPRFTAISFMRDVVCGASIYLTNQQQFERALAMREFLLPFCKAKKRELRTYARIYVSHVEFYVSFHRREDSLLELGESIISTCVRKKILQRIASTTAMLMISHLCNRNEMPQERMLKNDGARAMIDSYVEYFGNCCITYTGIDPEVEGSSEKMKEAMREVFFKKLRELSGELYVKDMNISAKTYAKLHTAEAFLELVFSNLLQALIETYREQPIHTEVPEPQIPAPPAPAQSEQTSSAPPRFVIPSRSLHPRFSYGELKRDYWREWQADQKEELRTWLLGSLCYAHRSMTAKNTVVDAPTGEWIERARAAWRSMREAMFEGTASNTELPALLFEGDGELLEKTRESLKSIGLSEELAEETAFAIQSFGGVLPIAPEDGIGGTHVDWDALDSLAEEQGYPRELFTLAGYALCMCDATLREKPIVNMARTCAEMGTLIDPYLTQLGYLSFNGRNPFDRYLFASFFVNVFL